MTSPDLQADFQALWLTIRLASLTTVLLLLVTTPLGWWLARTKWRLRHLLEALVALPLVLPPTVLGFYLLLLLGRNGPGGQLARLFGNESLAFTFPGLVIGSMVYSLPFVLQPIQGAFRAIDKRHIEVASTLRASPLDRFLTVVLPLSRSGFLTATVLGFAHTVGEFGVVLMIGGNIPGHTRVLSIAIYDHVEVLEYGRAHLLSGALLILSFVMLVGVYSFNGKRPGIWRQ